MVQKKLQEKCFLSPREAMEQYIWPALNPTKQFSILGIDQPEFQEALRSLYSALQSSKVSAFFHRFDGHERRLEPVQAANEFFKIDVVKDCCFFGPIVSRPCELKIHREELQAYLGAWCSQSSSRDSASCLSILTEVFLKRSEITLGRNDDERYGTLCETFTGLSRREYDRIKREAANKSNRPDLLKGGRPRGTKNKIVAPD